MIAAASAQEADIDCEILLCIGPFNPRLIDGDTLADGDTRIRLAGMDACETGQPVVFADHAEPLDCGAYAKVPDMADVCSETAVRNYTYVL